MKFKLAFLICFSTNVIFSQEICPVENVSVFGGDSQNIVSWDKPANPFVSTFGVWVARIEGWGIPPGGETPLGM